MASLHVSTMGGGTGVPVVLLHGFTQTGQSWGAFVDRLAEARPVVLVDLPGHGGSNAIEADLAETGDLVIDAASAAAPFDLVGYSLGGRVALHAVLQHPGAVRRVVLISATPGIEDDDQRAARRGRDNALADEIEKEDDVGDFIDRWLAAPMFAGLTAEPADRAGRLTNTASGLAASLRLAGTGSQSPLWGALGRITTPLLALAGAADPRFVDIAQRLARAVPNAAFTLISGAGHAAHLEQPQLSARTVIHWLAEP